MYSQDQAQEADPKKLFVGNLPYSVTEEQLTEIFAEFGELEEVKLITDRMTGRSRGIAFVRYVEKESADEAVKQRHDTDLDGRNIIVNVARPRAPRDNNRGGGYGGGNRGGNRGGYNNNRGGGYNNNDRY